MSKRKAMTREEARRSHQRQWQHSDSPAVEVVDVSRRAAHLHGVQVLGKVLHEGI